MNTIQPVTDFKVPVTSFLILAIISPIKSQQNENMWTVPWHLLLVRADIFLYTVLQFKQQLTVNPSNVNGLLYSRHCTECWGKQNRNHCCPLGAEILVGADNNNNHENNHNTVILELCTSDDKVLRLARHHTGQQQTGHHIVRKPGFQPCSAPFLSEPQLLHL